MHTFTVSYTKNSGLILPSLRRAYLPPPRARGRPINTRKTKSSHIAAAAGRRGKPTKGVRLMLDTNTCSCLHLYALGPRGVRHHRPEVTLRQDHQDFLPAGLQQLHHNVHLLKTREKVHRRKTPHGGKTQAPQLGGRPGPIRSARGLKKSAVLHHVCLCSLHQRTSLARENSNRCRHHDRKSSC